MLILCLRMYSDSDGGEQARRAITGKATSVSSTSSKAGSSADTPRAADQARRDTSSLTSGGDQLPQEPDLTGTILGAPVHFSLQKH